MLRRLIGPCAAAALTALIVAGLERFWLLILLAGMASAPFLGRWYCARLCPSNTLGRFLRPPKAARTGVPPWLRAVWFMVLGLVFIVSLAGGLRPRLFAILTGLSLVARALLPRGLWCRWFCPWTAASALLGRLLPAGFPRKPPPCHGCRTCTGGCPSRKVFSPPRS